MSASKFTPAILGVGLCGHRRTSLLLAHDPEPGERDGAARAHRPGFTLRVYTHLMRRTPDDRERLKALVSGTF